MPLRRFGKYVMYGPLASGGMASVYYGSVLDDDGTIRPVALKRVRAELTDPNFATMLSDEARIAGRVRHPNVVETLDVIVDAGEPMIALEYVPGVSLSLLLRTLRARDVHLPLPIAAALTTEVLSGIHAAHEAVDLAGQPLEIVHRDVSPANILLDERGFAKIADFGVAQARGRLQKTTDTGALKGKLGYLAPEQIHGAASRASDIYAVGVVLWEMLAGRPLFQGSDGEILAAALIGNVHAPSARRAEAAVLDDVVLKALEHDPARRYASAQHMAEAITVAVTPASHADVAAFLESSLREELEHRRSNVLTMLATVRSEDAFADSAAVEAHDGARQRRVRPRRRRKLLLALLVLVPLIALAAMALRIGPPRPPAREPVIASATASAALAPSAAEGEAPTDPALVTSSAPSAGKPAPRVSAPRPKKAAGKQGDCSPPYTIDKEGRTIWKRECFQK
jgi:serine/threonine-protein kinase